ncbi:thioredoxin fold domain-containing protein [Ferruginibacter lapsinanis]|uniref:rhodanese-like domain-containing protein n=1 Tax=Ferruginibacter lapsinanis TaxID=563172 RepID=UPI001E2C0559|nr:rhodanese-like domain-containing protein [Ferruginibacter lapsinanis]UEG50127.1 thioredoxin fold domain-containing protein [Ferruginibacter lapsinanis]
MKKIFFLLVSYVSLLTACNSEAQVNNLSVDEFEKAISKTDIQLLDVRTADEYQSGHLNNSMLADWNNKTEFAERVKALDKAKPVYTYCLARARSKAATEWLLQNGFNAYNLTGGIKAWKAANKPLVQAVSVKQMTMQEYMEQIPLDKTVLVDISADWCPPCRKMAPVVDSLVAMHGSKFVLLKINGAEQTGIGVELKVQSFPAFFIYKEGKIVWQKEGIVDIKEFIQQL